MKIMRLKKMKKEKIMILYRVAVGPIPTFFLSLNKRECTPSLQIIANILAKL